MEKLTYEKITALIAEQDRLVAEGKMPKPVIKYGFTPRQRWEFDHGTPIEEFARKHNIFDYEEEYSLVV
jgi:GH35 family endo-1,4-beta-xylanase